MNEVRYLESFLKGRSSGFGAGGNVIRKRVVAEKYRTRQTKLIKPRTSLPSPLFIPCNDISVLEGNDINYISPIPKYLRDRQHGNEATCIYELSQDQKRTYNMPIYDDTHVTCIAKTMHITYTKYNTSGRKESIHYGFDRHFEGGSERVWSTPRDFINLDPITWGDYSNVVNIVEKLKIIYNDIRSTNGNEICGRYPQDKPKRDRLNSLVPVLPPRTITELDTNYRLIGHTVYDYVYQNGIDFIYVDKKTDERKKTHGIDELNRIRNIRRI
jgi:hypothetical protein